MTHTLISRRSLTSGLAAAVTAVPAAGLCKGAKGPSEFAALARRYFAEVAAFNADARGDDNEFYNADQPFDATLQQMIGVPIRNNDDATAAAEMVLECGRGCMIDFGEGPHGRLAEWSLHALRDYLAGKVEA